jgi:glutamyl-tRNA reductase
MSRYLAQRLPERGMHVTMANRTQAKAEAFGLPVVPLAQLQANPKGFDAIVTATASSEPLFLKGSWAHLDHPAVKMVDLALPYDSEPALAEIEWVTRLDLPFFLAETEVGKATRRVAALDAEPFIVGAVDRLRRRAGTRHQKAGARSSQERLADAWELMEAEATGPGSVLGALAPEQLEALEALLKRGRTLAFRAMNAQREPALELVQ